MSDRGIRCGRAVRHSRWHGAVSSALVSRSRAMPVGDRRSTPRACSWLAMRDLAARRAAVPGFALPRDAGRRPALQSPRFFVVGARCAISRRASSSGAGFRAPARCRSETGAPLFRGWRSAISPRRAAVPGFALPRDAGRRPALRFFVVGDPRSRGASRSGAGFRAPARCRSETGAPLFRGWRSAISRRVAQRCRVSRSRAMPVGDRRSAFSWLAIRDLAARRAAVPGFALPRDAGRRPALRFFVVGDARSRCASRSGAGFRAPARCRSETGAPLFRGWRCAISLRVAQRCRVSRSRAMPVGDRRSAFSWLAMRDLAARRAAVPGFALPRDAGRRPALRFWRCAISWLAMRDLAARRAAVPGFALPRDAGRRPALRFFVVGDPRSRGASRSGAGFRAPARCRSETGAPLFRGWRCAISRRVAQRCRVSRSRAMPVGDRRSFAVGDAPSGQLGSPGARGIRKKPS